MTIEEYEPKNVFKIFSEICAIPHGSGNTEKLRKWCADFAEKRGLEYDCDGGGNILIRKPASVGFEKSETLIIQGHLDMVCEKNADCAADMENDGISLKSDGEYIFADGTTLGGDDGIAIAFALVILDDDTILHPPLEILLTADEETGMFGANSFDCTKLRGKRLINIDSEEEGILTAGCAGGIRCKCSLPLEFEAIPNGFTCLKVTLSGLLGGHSGVDIASHRANAVKLLARALERVEQAVQMRICSINGGNKDNVIPNSAEAVIAVSDTELAIHSITCFEDEANAKLCGEKADFTVEKCDCNNMSFDNKNGKKLLFLLLNVPDGVVEMSTEIPDAVTISLNLGSAKTVENSLCLLFLLRSNTVAGRHSIEEKLSSFMKKMGAKIEFSASYPPWEYKTNSKLREIMSETYSNMFEKKPVVQTIHAGLECAVFDSKIENADMVSFGPDIENVHTPNERMKIASVQRSWNYLLKVLENLK